MADPRPVLLIGLDAADSLLVEELVEAGAMPNLAHLRRSGTRGELVSRPEGLSAMRWSKFFEGGRIARFYFPKAWNPEAMRLDWVMEFERRSATLLASSGRCRPPCGRHRRAARPGSPAKP